MSKIGVWWVGGMGIIALWLVSAVSALPHPADSDSNYQLSESELSAYNQAYKLQTAWTSAPSPPTISYYSRAIPLFKLAASYHNDPAQACPACYVSGPDAILPMVSIDYPLNGVIVNSATLVVQGSASDDAGIASVTVNGVVAATTNGYAIWTATITLVPGANTITAVATDASAQHNTQSSSISVTYSPPTYLLTVSKSGAGTITSTPLGISCGAICSASFSGNVLLAAAPAAGSVFASWSGDATSCGANPSCTLTIDRAKSAIATFNTVAPGTLIWAKTVFTDAGSNLIPDNIASVATDSSGNTFIGGKTTDVPPFLAKISPSNGILWQKQFSTQGGYSIVNSIATGSDGSVYIIGYFWNFIELGGERLVSNGVTGYHVFLAKYSSEGNHLWSKVFSNTIGYLDGWKKSQSLAVGSDGSVIITGVSSGYMDFGGGPVGNPNNMDNIFLAKFSSSGSYVWAQNIQSGGNAYFNSKSTSIDDQGNIFVTGGFSANTMFLEKYLSNGTNAWKKEVIIPGGLSSSYVVGKSLTVDSTGNVLVLGEFKNTVNFGGGTASITPTSTSYSDIFLVKYSTAGIAQWVRKWGAQYAEIGSSVKIDSNNNLYISGIMNYPFDLGEGIPAPFGLIGLHGFLAKFRPDGTFGAESWTKQFGLGIGNDGNMFTSVDMLGGVYAAGKYYKLFRYGGSNVTANANDGSGFLLKYAN